MEGNLRKKWKEIYEKTKSSGSDIYSIRYSIHMNEVFVANIYIFFFKFYLKEIYITRLDDLVFELKSY